MIAVEGELAAVPLIMVLLGAGWFYYALPVEGGTQRVTTAGALQVRYRLIACTLSVLPPSVSTSVLLPGARPLRSMTSS
jgi:hypothetical protein